jgi:spermidine synthase
MADSKRQARGGRKTSPPTATTAPDQRGTRWRRVFLLAAAFLSGAAIMVLELAGNRILAPWFGNSTCTWTGLIGVVLISLSCGYYLGGYLADRWPNYSVLAHLLVVSAALTMLVPVLQAAVADSVSAASVVSGPILATLLLLAAPACLLAAVSPFTVKLLSLLSADQRVGVSAGAIGMCATLGSVLGTFATGLVLVPHLGLQMIFWGTGVVLGLLALAGYLLFSLRFRQNRAAPAALVAVLAVLSVGSLHREPLPETIVFEQTTPYHRIRVIEAPVEDGDRIRYLFLDTTAEGGCFLRSRQPALQYHQAWELSRLFFTKPGRAAFLGGGAFSMPEVMLDAFPGLEADVVEVDPAVIEVGRKYFRTGEYPRLHATAGDARRFLRFTPERYDLIVGDAFHGVRSIPGHLVTVEFFDLVRQRLTADGVYLMNIASAVEGRQSPVFRSIAATVREVFPHVEVFAAEPDRPAKSQNLILVASARDLAGALAAGAPGDRGGDLPRLLAGRLDARQYDDPDAPILRDARNPIEYLVAQGLATQ